MGLGFRGDLPGVFNSLMVLLGFYCVLIIRILLFRVLY